ncbi:VOC family protein [Nocardia farcinica]|uniref:VOC family protein n=1 Tax=Nocardia farcinica TaxID=37329 RepID=UPI003CC7D730
MIGYFGINVPDLAAAKAYYDELVPLLDFEEFLGADDQFAYRPARGKPGTYLFVYPAAEDAAYSRHGTGLQHIAFMVPGRRRGGAVPHRARGRAGAPARPLLHR